MIGADINASLSLLKAACASGGGGAPVLQTVDALVIAFRGSAVWENLGMSDLKLFARPKNGTITYKPRRQQRRQCAQAHNSTPYRRQQSVMYWLCSKQKALLCTY
jgi:hypothetical protein